MTLSAMPTLFSPSSSLSLFHQIWSISKHDVVSDLPQAFEVLSYVLFPHAFTSSEHLFHKLSLQIDQFRYAKHVAMPSVCLFKGVFHPVNAFTTSRAQRRCLLSQSIHSLLHGAPQGAPQSSNFQSNSTAPEPYV